MEQQIQALNDAYVRLLFEVNPSMAVQFGVRGFEDKLFNESIEFHITLVVRLEELKVKVIRLEEEARGNLSKKEREDIAFLKEAINASLLIEGVPGEEGYNLELGNNHFFGSLVGLEAAFEQDILETPEDIQKYHTKLALIPAQCSHMIDNYKRGIKRKATLNAVGVSLLINVAKSLYGDGKDVLVAAKESGLNRASKAAQLVHDPDYLVPLLKDQVLPAIRNVADFLEHVYAKYARKEDGISAIPGAYERYIKTNTEIGYSAEAIHSIGLAEVARINDLLEVAKKNCGVVTSLKQFQSDLLDRTKFPHLFFKDSNEIIPECNRLIGDARARMVTIFDRFPKFECQVKPVPANLEATAALGQYAAGTGAEGGVFTINMRLQKQKPSHQLKALCLHEGNPGHHHQCSIVAENGNEHLIRRIVMSGPYVEGWGLYSEFLGEELGMYTDPFEYFGRLEFEMWRACRLVVDSGLHGKGWTIEQSVEFMQAHVSMTRDEAVTEVNRYTAIPGQALNYKIGELKIKELRGFAEEALGEEFSVKEFHSVVLGRGAVPLAMLDATVKEWVASKKESRETVLDIGAMDDAVDEKKLLLDLPSSRFSMDQSASKAEEYFQEAIFLVLAGLFFVVLDIVKKM
ncbi:hypothetical protein HDU99_008296 [Rhizoclosmatium hyalinum]|nr:hypothetical protein HDU99_008296 [Rhizoclosmatium hyalinum]